MEKNICWLVQVKELSIKVNGEIRSAPAGSTVLEVIATVGMSGLVAVERNKVLVPRAKHGSTTVVDGDELEIVSFVGGG